MRILVAGVISAALCGQAYAQQAYVCTGANGVKSFQQSPCATAGESIDLRAPGALGDTAAVSGHYEMIEREKATRRARLQRDLRHAQMDYAFAKERFDINARSREVRAQEAQAVGTLLNAAR